MNAPDNMKMKNLRLFGKSLNNHPGLLIGTVWPFMVAMAMIMRPDTPELSTVLKATLIIGPLPWIVILYTAWTGRKYYD